MNICKRHDEEKVLYGKKFKCRSCNREHQAKWFSDNRVTQRTRVKANTDRYVARNQQYVLNFLNCHPCIDCGESNILMLEFDHINDDKYKNIADMIRNANSLKSLILEINKCEVVCANHHRVRTAIRFGSYRLNHLKKTNREFDPPLAHALSRFEDIAQFGGATS